MDSKSIMVTEIFHSLQGETSLSGVRFGFVRLTGCDLRCSYCDSSYAFSGGKRVSFAEILETLAPYSVKHVLLTGGEPLLQKGTPALADILQGAGYQVSIETHGEVSVAPVAGKARIIMDIKTPSSGMCRGGFRKNLPLLQSTDEIKFVIASAEDYYWARALLSETTLPVKEILFSPVTRTAGAPAEYPGVDPRWLAEQVIQDRLPVRLQLQLHKQLWGPDQRGV